MASYRYERDIKPEDLIQETPPPLTPAQQRANWWHYHWYYVVLIAAALLAVGYLSGTESPRCSRTTPWQW